MAASKKRGGGWKNAKPKTLRTVTLAVRQDVHKKCREVRNLLAVLEGDTVSLSETVSQGLDLLKAHVQQMLRESANVRKLMR